MVMSDILALQISISPFINLVSIYIQKKQSEILFFIFLLSLARSHTNTKVKMKMKMKVNRL